jgi:AraC family transcriptional regulator, transcriptional activator of pobA
MNAAKASAWQSVPATHIASLAGLAPLGAWQTELVHDRAHHLLVWITRGQGRALIGGTRRGFGAHNALFIPAGDLMALEFGRQSAGLALSIPPGADLTLPADPRHLRVRDLRVQTEIGLLLDGLTREQHDARPRFQDAMDAHARLVAIWLRRQLADPGYDGDKADSATLLARAFCARVASGHRRAETMASHARALGVSPNHLSRILREKTGQGGSDLLAERRLHGARTLLATTDAPIGNIARHLGFGDPASFARFVKRHTGRSPSALRSP